MRMWVCLNNAFLSIVRDRDDAGRLCVRARNRAHLEALFPDDLIVETPNADYACRLFVKEATVAEHLMRRVCGIDYTDFKGSVGEHALHELYREFWVASAAYQARASRRDTHLAWGEHDLRRVAPKSDEA